MVEMPRPLDALNNARNKRVIVDLKNKTQFVGVLKAFDIHINVVLDDGELRENSELKKKVGTVFIRGDTIVAIATE
jgi:small nuclear ribonucleoprotein